MMDIKPGIIRLPDPVQEAEIKRLTKEFNEIVNRMIEQYSKSQNNMSETNCKPKEKIDTRDAHYQLNSNRQLIDVMQEVFTRNEVYTWCKLNVFKYTSRAGKKCSGGEDMRKAAWYAQKAQEIFNEMNTTGTGILTLNQFPSDVKISEEDTEGRTLKDYKE